MKLKTPPAPNKKGADGQDQPHASDANKNITSYSEESPLIVAPLELKTFFNTEPEPLDFLWAGGPLAGTVGALIAPGGAGKSFFALQAAIAIAAKEQPQADLLDIEPTKGGIVDYYALEDPMPVLWHRLHAIGSHLPPTAREAVQKNLRLRPMVGQLGFDLVNPDPDFIPVAPIAHAIIAESTDSRLIILDTLSRAHSYDENKNGEMALLLRTLEYIAKETSATVLFLHHTNKGSAREGQGAEQQSARGASALIDNARWAAFVQTMTEKESHVFFAPHETEPIGNDGRKFYLRYGVNKQNYGSHENDTWYERTQGGVLRPVELFEQSQQQQRENLRGNRNRRVNNDDW